MNSMTRWWPAGAQPPCRQIILLAELIACPDNMNPKNAESNNTKFQNAGPGHAESKNAGASNAKLPIAEPKLAESMDKEFKNACMKIETDESAPVFRMKRYRFLKKDESTTVYVSWQGSSLCADDVVNHMREYGPCTLDDWDFQKHGRAQRNTATIEYTNPKDAERAESFKRIQIENDEKEFVPAEISWQMSAVT
jgi:hypothetical protein